MAQQPTASPLTPAAAPGGPNGDRSEKNALASLATMVAQMEGPPAASDTPEAASPTASAQQSDAPDTPQTPAPGDETGQTTDLPAEEKPEGEAEAAPSTDDSQTTAELTAALEGLPPERAQKILDLAKTGELPRIGKLVADLHAKDATIETQQQRIEELEAVQEHGAPAPADSALPEPVMKLKTLAEVKQATKVAQRTLQVIEDLFEEQAYNGDPNAAQYTFGEKTWSRRELLAEKKAAQATLNALPDRAEQIQSQTQFETNRQQTRALFHQNFPWAKDPQSAQSKEIQTCLQQNPWMKSFPNPEGVAAIWLYGSKPLAKELELRQGKAGSNGRPAGQQAGKPAAVIQPRIPLDKRGVKPAPGAAEVTSAVETEVPKTGTRESLAGLLAVTGR